MISRQDNITDPSRSDGRCNQANEFHQDYGALSNQVTSPIREQSRNQSFSEDRSDAYLLAQDKLFDLLKEDQKLPGNEFTQNGGKLCRNQIQLTAEELCNTIDEVTLAFLDEVGRTTDSMSAKQ